MNRAACLQGVLPGGLTYATGCIVAIDLRLPAYVASGDCGNTVDAESIEDYQPNLIGETPWRGNNISNSATPPFTLRDATAGSFSSLPAASNLEYRPGVGVCGEPIAFHTTYTLPWLASIR